jgi:hypothetical protein
MFPLPINELFSWKVQSAILVNHSMATRAKPDSVLGRSSLFIAHSFVKPCLAWPFRANMGSFTQLYG